MAKHNKLSSLADLNLMLNSQGLKVGWPEKLATAATHSDDELEGFVARVCLGYVVFRGCETEKHTGIVPRMRPDMYLGNNFQIFTW
jgi:hypothetical protein